VGALQFSGEELQADVTGAQFLGERGKVDAMAEPFVLGLRQSPS
jgi:hypothetical protein